MDGIFAISALFPYLAVLGVIVCAWPLVYRVMRAHFFITGVVLFSLSLFLVGVSIKLTLLLGMIGVFFMYSGNQENMSRSKKKLPDEKAAARGRETKADARYVSDSDDDDDASTSSADSEMKQESEVDIDSLLPTIPPFVKKVKGIATRVVVRKKRPQIDDLKAALQDANERLQKAQRAYNHVHSAYMDVHKVAKQLVAKYHKDTHKLRSKLRRASPNTTKEGNKEAGMKRSLLRNSLRGTKKRKKRLRDHLGNSESKCATSENAWKSPVGDAPFTKRNATPQNTRAEMVAQHEPGIEKMNNGIPAEIHLGNKKHRNDKAQHNGRSFHVLGLLSLDGKSVKEIEQNESDIEEKNNKRKHKLTPLVSDESSREETGQNDSNSSSEKIRKSRKRHSQCHHRSGDISPMASDGAISNTPSPFTMNEGTRAAVFRNHAAFPDYEGSGRANATDNVTKADLFWRAKAAEECLASATQSFWCNFSSFPAETPSNQTVSPPTRQRKKLRDAE